METLIKTIKKQHKLFYENQMNYQYKKYEKTIKDIINKNVKPIDDKVICIISYCGNIKVKNLIMANDLTLNKQKSAMSHVIYA